MSKKKVGNEDSTTFINNLKRNTNIGNIKFNELAYKSVRIISILYKRSQFIQGFLISLKVVICFRLEAIDPLFNTEVVNCPVVGRNFGTTIVTNQILEFFFLKLQ